MRVAEALLVLGLTLSVFYFGYQVVSGRASDKDWAAFKSVAENWKALLLILIPLFYRTVQLFLEQAHEAFGIKRNLRKLHEADEVITKK
jgi:ABC-type nickel/cobalt efflux system permease component RcnA